MDLDPTPAMFIKSLSYVRKHSSDVLHRTMASSSTHVVKLTRPRTNRGSVSGMKCALSSGKTCVSKGEEITLF